MSDNSINRGIIQELTHKCETLEKCIRAIDAEAAGKPLFDPRDTDDERWTPALALVAMLRQENKLLIETTRRMVDQLKKLP